MKFGDEDVTDAAIRMGAELAESASEAFATFCETRNLDPPTEREKVLIKVLSLQLASSIATALADREKE
jgi:hypothetical protein